MDKIASALVKAQRAFGPALKTHTNPAFKSKYADLGACIEAVIDALNSAGIALIQRQHQNEGGVTVETIFLHESGEQFSAGMLSVPAVKQDPQGYGSALTYARRYSLMAACGIAPEDDDGNAAGKRPAQSATSARQEKHQQPHRDTSPLAVAGRIKDGVKAGDAARAAEYLASLDQDALTAIWELLDGKTQDQLTKAWPK